MRRARKPEARPDEILDAALRVFDSHGFDAARMEDVAAEAGLSKAGVYLYFDSKTALLRALIRRTIAPMAQRAMTLAEAGAGDPPGALRAIAVVLAGALGDPRLFAVPRLVIGVASRFPDIAETYRDEVVTPARQALRRLFEAGMARGVFAPGDPDQAVRAFAGPLLFEALRRHVLRDEAPPQDWVATHVEFMLAALAPRAAS